MDMAVLLVSIGAMIVAGIAAAAAIAQANAASDSLRDARKATKASEDARDEAAVLSRKATDAFTRQAEALEDANRIAKAAIPQKRVEWRVTESANGRWMVKNVGELVARAAWLEGPPQTGINPDQEGGTHNIAPGNSLSFHVWRGSGMLDPILRVHCLSPTTGEDEVVEILLPI